MEDRPSLGSQPLVGGLGGSTSEFALLGVANDEPLEESGWVFEEPLSSQFPLSSFLADKLNSTASNPQSRGPLEPTSNSEKPRQLAVALSLAPPPTSEKKMSDNIQGVTDPLSSRSQVNFPCGTCGRCFESQVKLDIHARRHKKDHQCAECSQSFAEPRDLRRHIDARHKQLRTSCPHCGKNLKKRNDNLQRHINRYCKNVRGMTSG